MATFPYNSDYDPALPVVDFIVSHRGEVSVSALLDTGADATMLPLPILNSVSAPFSRLQGLRGIVGDWREVSLYRVTIEIASFRLPAIQVVALDPSDEAILGRDVLNQLIVTLDGIGGVTEIS